MRTSSTTLVAVTVALCLGVRPIDRERKRDTDRRPRQRRLEESMHRVWMCADAWQNAFCVGPWRRSTERRNGKPN